MAARKIAWENAQLRELLASRGVSDQDVKNFLQGRDQTKSTFTSHNITNKELQGHPSLQADGHLYIDPFATVSPTTQFPDTEEKEHDSNTRVHDTDAGPTVDGNGIIVNASSNIQHFQILPQGPSAHKPSLIRPSALRPHQLSLSGYAPGSAESDYGRNSTQLSLGAEGEQRNLLVSPLPECYYPDIPAQSSSGKGTSTLEMSCETAASIIASMRGNGDDEQARLELGCADFQQCTIDNIKVMQVMEMD